MRVQVPRVGDVELAVALVVGVEGHAEQAGLVERVQPRREQVSDVEILCLEPTDRSSIVFSES